MFFVKNPNTVTTLNLNTKSLLLILNRFTANKILSYMRFVILSSINFESNWIFANEENDPILKVVSSFLSIDLYLRAVKGFNEGFSILLKDVATREHLFSISFMSRFS